LQHRGEAVDFRFGEPAADVVRVADGVLAEHWDVLQDEVTEGRVAKRVAPLDESPFGTWRIFPPCRAISAFERKHHEFMNTRLGQQRAV
jgi:hypothetical protein